MLALLVVLPCPSSSLANNNAASRPTARGKLVIQPRRGPPGARFRLGWPFSVTRAPSRCRLSTRRWCYRRKTFSCSQCGSEAYLAVTEPIKEAAELSALTQSSGPRAMPRPSIAQGPTSPRACRLLRECAAGAQGRWSPLASAGGRVLPCGTSLPNRLHGQSVGRERRLSCQAR